MTQVVGVRWREADPVSYATAEDFTLPMKSYVVVQMEKSQELAWVCRDSKQLVACLPDSGLRIRVVHRAPRPVTLVACNRTVNLKKWPSRLPVKSQGIKHSHEDRRRTLHL